MNFGHHWADIAVLGRSTDMVLQVGEWTVTPIFGAQTTLAAALDPDLNKFHLTPR